MTHERRFRPTDGTFEDTFPNYYGARLVSVVLRLGDVMSLWRSQEGSAGVLAHLFSFLNPSSVSKAVPGDKTP
jgi:hypothetical protein